MASDGPILYGDPLDRGHPLNRGLAACYRPLPGRGGGCLPDLTGRPPAAFAGGPTGSAGMPGGTAAVAFDGSSGEAVGAVPAGLTVANLTLFVWARFSGASLKGCVLKVGGTSSGVGVGIGNSAFESPGVTILGLMEASRWLNSGVNIGDGWNSIGLTTGPTGAGNLWLNGASISSFSASGSDVNPTGSVYVGGYTASGAENRHFPGSVGEARVYARGLTAGEMAALHGQMTAGCPDLYRRVPARRRGFTPTSPPPPPAGSSFTAAVVGGGYGW